jgi:hypothetical protein
MQIQNFPSGIPLNDDLFLFQNSVDKTYRKGLFSDIVGSSANWAVVTSSYTAKNGDKIFINSSNQITLNLSNISKGELEVFNNSPSNVSINLGANKYKSAIFLATSLFLKPQNYVKLVFINATIGLHPVVGELADITVPPPGMSLWIEGSLVDKSSNNRTISPVGTLSPSIAVGLDNKNVLRWSGAGNQELQVTPFLTGTTGATVYVVYTVNSPTVNYNLIRTSNVDDYWRFSGDTHGYIGTFRNNRGNQYPLSMPNTGSHLISIHATGTNYEVILDKVSKGMDIGTTYTPGDRFRIVTNDKAFAGDVSLILVYPTFIDKASTNHNSILQTIKNNYPSLPFTL